MSKFRLSAEAALEAAADFGLTDVVVIGRDDDDEIHVWASTAPNGAFDLIEEGVDEVQTCAVNEDRDASDDEDEG